MLFKDLSKETIERSVKELVMDNKQAQHELEQKMIDYYDNNQLEYLRGYGFEVTIDNQIEVSSELGKRLSSGLPASTRWIIPPSWCNITKQVIDRISLAYKYNPDRTLKRETQEDADVPEVDEYNQWIDRYPRFNLTMSDVEIYTNLLGKTLFRPICDVDKKRWKFYNECMYEAHFLPDDPLHPVAYSIPLKRDVENEHYSRDQRWLFWSDELYFEYDNNGKYYVDDYGGKNPFKKIPLVEYRKRLPVNYYSTNGAVDLVQCNESINVALMNLGMMLHFQAFDQIYENSGTKAEDWRGMTSGANKVWHLPEGSTAGLLGFNPKIIESVEAIRAQVQMISQTYGLKMSWSIDGTPASGFSLLVQNIELLENRQRDSEIYSIYEQEVYDVISTMQNFYAGRLPKNEPRLPLGAEVIVDFQEMNFPVNWQEEQEKWDWEIKNNAASIVDYIQSKEGLSEEEAIERFERNKKLNARYGIKDMLRQRIEDEGGAVLPGGTLEEQ